MARAEAATDALDGWPHAHPITTTATDPPFGDASQWATSSSTSWVAINVGMPPSLAARPASVRTGRHGTCAADCPLPVVDAPRGIRRVAMWRGTRSVGDRRVSADTNLPFGLPRPAPAVIRPRRPRCSGTNGGRRLPNADESTEHQHRTPACSRSKPRQIGISLSRRGKGSGPRVLACLVPPAGGQICVRRPGTVHRRPRVSSPLSVPGQWYRTMSGPDGGWRCEARGR
jgi:hypothetical protein